MSLTQKTFVLNFITNYLPIFLTAFVYVPFGDVVIPRLETLLHSSFGQLGNGSTKFQSDPDRLRNEVIALTVTGQIASAAEELLVPYMKTRFQHWWRDYRDHRDAQAGRTNSFSLRNDDPAESIFLKRVRAQAILPFYDVQEDIAEMVIQFGYLALFSPVWPLVPIGFLINNWIELRSDFLKICIEHQRPAPVRSDGIGPWINSLEVLNWLGSISTAAIVHLFGSNTLGYSSGMDTWYYLPITIFISEHIFLLLRAAVRFALDKIGSEHIRKEKSEQYAERKKFLDELERSRARSGHLDVGERARRKSVRIQGLDLFWTRQADDGQSVEAGAKIIKAMANADRGQKED